MKSSGFRLKSSRNYFTKQEDELLKTIIQAQKKINWDEISSYLEGKTSRQCRDRWRNYLAPGLKIRNWSIEEDRILFEKFQEYGTKWIDIAYYFPGRTTNDIKNRYHIKIKKRNQMKEVKQKNNMFCDFELFYFPEEDNFDSLNIIT
jgi:hypothetical protein